MNDWIDGPVVAFEDVSVRYADSDVAVLDHVSFAIEEGEIALVVGRTGSGKSTLLGAINGTVPHFTGGTLSGRVSVLGRDTRTFRPRDLADIVGVVGQDPLAGFVADTVEEELAYAMEQLGLPASVMRKRVEETLDVFGIAELRSVPLLELSGGQQQRVAIGSVLTAHPKVIVLDEPTSALDPTGAEEVLATVTRLAHDLAVTVIIAEHRIERVAQYADRIVHVGSGLAQGRVDSGAPAAVMATSDVAPPVVQLGRWAGWSPLPLSVRDARRAASGLRAQLRDRPDSVPPTGSGGAEGGPGEVALRAKGVTVKHGPVIAVSAVNLALHEREITAIMGRNGAGKSSLLWALQGSGQRAAGTVRASAGEHQDIDPAHLSAAERRTIVGLVPQSASDLLYLESVGHELAQADRESSAPAGTARAFLDRLAPRIADETHPRDLSEGQRLALVLAIQLTARPPIMLLDEPTRGLDYDAKAALTQVLRSFAAEGLSIVLSTHDVEFVAAVADRVVVMASGEIVADGPARDVVIASPAFAPQVAKILAPARLLTVAEVRVDLPDPTEGAP